MRRYEHFLAAVFLTLFVWFILLLISLVKSSDDPARLETFKGEVIDRIDKSDGITFYFTDGRTIKIHSSEVLYLDINLLEETQ